MKMYNLKSAHMWVVSTYLSVGTVFSSTPFILPSTFFLDFIFSLINIHLKKVLVGTLYRKYRLVNSFPFEAILNFACVNFFRKMVPRLRFSPRYLPINLRKSLYQTLSNRQDLVGVLLI